MNPAASPYVPRRRFDSRFLHLRGLRHHVLCWGNPALASPQRPLRLMMHGWMDVGASFQFVVDALQDDAPVVAMDWRGFGRSESGGVDAFWFPDYLGDLDALLDQLSPKAPVDLIGHSMGGNVVMSYAGLRPERVRRLVNLEGFGLPDTRAEDAPERLLRWLDELKAPQQLRPYESLDGVAQRLIKTNPRLSPDKAAWLAPQWSEPREGRWHILGDPAHKRANPTLYRSAEVLACWRRIAAPTLFVEGEHTQLSQWWGDRYPRSELDARLAVVPSLRRELLREAGHMLHHDQPQAVAALLLDFLR